MAKIQQALPPDKTGKRTYGIPVLPSGSRVKAESALTASDGGATKRQNDKPFDGMNNIVANLMLNLTRLAQIKANCCQSNAEVSYRIELLICVPMNRCRFKVFTADLHR